MKKKIDEGEKLRRAGKAQLDTLLDGMLDVPNHEKEVKKLHKLMEKLRKSAAHQ